MLWFPQQSAVHLGQPSHSTRPQTSSREQGFAEAESRHEPRIDEESHALLVVRSRYVMHRRGIASAV